MRRPLGFLFLLPTLPYLLLFGTACSHTGTAGDQKTYSLMLKGDASSQPVITKYFTKSVSQQVKNRSFATEESSEMSFTEVRTYQSDLSEENKLAFEITTQDKQGAMSLHEMAFPEPGEKIQMVYSPKAEVLAADQYPQNSIFYVPSISLPQKPVPIGATWTGSYQWVSLETGLPFHLELVTIFKGVKDCQARRCAQLEVAGDTSLQGGISTSGGFSGRLTGEILFDIDQGQVMASDIQSMEQVTLPDLLLRSSSCLKSRVQGAGQSEALGCVPQDFDELTPTVMNTNY